MSIEPDIEIPTSELYVVGVGASAGGLDALTKFLSGLHEEDYNLSIIVVMHLSPSYKSELTSILEKRCPWPVLKAVHKQHVKPRHVYVTPPNAHITIHEDKIHLQPLNEEFSPSPSIDYFFSSLARVCGNKGIGVVLSGFGKDGTEGLKEIQRQGGLTLAQLPDTAEHIDMPSSAIQAGATEKILPPEHMYGDIQQFIQNQEAVLKSRKHERSIDAIFDLLEKRSGTNFAYYKPSTILRRINVRMNSLNLNSLTEYYKLLKKKPTELDKLFETVLIGVTSFFRDEKAYEGLEEELKKILTSKKAGEAIRVWSVGCASGEEPYSLAILMHEILGKNVSKHHIQIFASDIDEGALNACRKGVYTKDKLANLPTETLERYFYPKGDGFYEVKKIIKQHILFTRHDISKDPPFVKIDLLVCRNLLIYFNNQLQKQTFQIFHYALKNKGLLLLGKSESVSVAPSLFNKVNKYKLFQKSDHAPQYHLKFSRYVQNNDDVERQREHSQNHNATILEAAQYTLYHQYEHPFVIITEEAEIREVHGSLRLYLEIGEGAMNANIFKMANKELVPVLQALTAQVKRTGVPHTSQILKFSLYDADHWVRIKIAPLLYPVNKRKYLMVFFMKVEETDQLVQLQQKLSTADLVDYRIQELEDELATTREHLQIFTEELEATNEELQTINEELQSSNEELKSSNEELETSNEELQSANEELNTANYELRLTNEALLKKEEELRREKEQSERNLRLYKLVSENIPNGAVGLLDSDFKIAYIAGKGFEKFYTGSKIVGNSFPELVSSGDEKKKLVKVLRKTLRGKSANTVFTYGDNYYDLQTVPVNHPGVDQVNIMFLIQDITEQKRQELKLNMVLQSTEVIIYEYDYKKGEYKPNPRLNKLFGYAPDVVLTKKMLLDRFHPDDLKKRNKLQETAMKEGHISYEARLQLKSGTKWIKMIGEILFDAEGNADLKVAAVQDITKVKQELVRTQEREKHFRFIADSTPAMIWIGDKDLDCTYLNQKWLEFTGRDLEACMGEGWIESVHPDDRDRRRKLMQSAYTNAEPFNIEYRLRKHDGTYRHILDHGVPILNQKGDLDGFMGSCVDITPQKNFTKELERSVSERTLELKRSNEELVNLNLNLEQYAYAASHDLQEPLRKIQTFISMINQRNDDPEKVNIYLEKIEKASNRMRTLVKDILDYNAIKDEDIKVQVNLDELVMEIESDLDLIIKEKKASIIREELGSVYGVRSQLYQLFVNLLKNSLIYNEGEPRIVFTREVKPGTEIDNDLEVERDMMYHCFMISDNGIGLDPENFSYLIKPFKRSHTRQKYPGSGLGLAICDRIISLHKGVWGVDSSPGNGTTFKICLPMDEEE